MLTVPVGQWRPVFMRKMCKENTLQRNNFGKSQILDVSNGSEELHVGRQKWITM